VTPKSDGVERFHRYVDSFATTAPNPGMTHYPGLRSVPWRGPATVPLVADLEAAFAQVAAELRALDDSSFHDEPESIDRSGSWELVLLYERGRRHDEICRRCPVTTAIVERHATVRTLAGVCYLSRLAAHTEVAAHHGPTNLRSRCHLGVDIPDGDCAIRVGDEVRSWQPGRCLVFDDYCEHEVWNRTDQTRTVLVVDVWHPDLDGVERALLNGLHRYVAANAEHLAHYWAGPDKGRTQARHPGRT
jgi:aspartyl/asparaginyl beta-hydroxylase (cupin superfamily)